MYSRISREIYDEVMPEKLGDEVGGDLLPVYNTVYNTYIRYSTDQKMETLKFTFAKSIIKFCFHSRKNKSIMAATNKI